MEGSGEISGIGSAVSGGCPTDIGADCAATAGAGAGVRASCDGAGAMLSVTGVLDCWSVLLFLVRIPFAHLVTAASQACPVSSHCN